MDHQHRLHQRPLLHHQNQQLLHLYVLHLLHPSPKVPVIASPRPKRRLTATMTHQILWLGSEIRFQVLSFDSNINSAILSSILRTEMVNVMDKLAIYREIVLDLA
jgi:hypothetical protein